ncbi:unnamed protein product [Rhizoctonia solani]|uniref:HAT C-terminal dimerisation domain-containing protein n=1 Tax=Rhizoctonia solani TaxID=456999 RepID=A0A8H3AII4_9AGAM|nr:unnamed protein product [Rhizoctonia solani]
MDPLDTDKQYAIVKSFEEDEIFERSAEVLEEEEQLRTNKNESDTHAILNDTSDEELDNSAVGNQADTIDFGSQPSQNFPSSELNCVQKIHCIVVDITSSAARRKQMRAITWALGLELHAVIKSVKVRWNSILAEIRRAILLKAAINQYVLTLDNGKSRALLWRARALKKKWSISDKEWDVLCEIVKILEPFESATRDYSKRGRTVLYSVLPTYITLQEKLTKSRVHLNTLLVSSSGFETLVEALKAGEEKLDKYFHLALKSNLTLLASIFHPGMRIKYFKDTQRWGNLGTQLAKQGCELLEYLYELYKLETVPGQPETRLVAGQKTSVNNLGWIDGLLDLADEATDSTFPEEVRNYLDGKYQYKGGDILAWWKENESHIPVLSRIARDILAIPATSVSVERLFSRCKLVMSDYRNMTRS